MKIRITRPLQMFAALGYGKSTGWDRIKNGLLPKPFSLGGISVGVFEHEVQAVAAARGAGKTDDEIRGLVQQLEAQRKTLTAQSEAV